MYRLSNGLFDLHEEKEARKGLKMNNKWMKRFAKHYEFEPFFLSPYVVKKTVEKILAITYKGEVKNEDRKSFEDRYKSLFSKYKKIYNIIEENNYNRNTWRRLIPDKDLYRRYLEIKGKTVEQVK